MTPRQQRIPLNKDDEKYMIHCMSRYGVDYKKMFRDTKINYMQHTEEKLQKLGNRFLRLQSNQRSVQDIPESLQKLIDNPPTISED
jgi:Ribosome biogenesis protein Nop16